MSRYGFLLNFSVHGEKMDTEYWLTAWLSLLRNSGWDKRPSEHHLSCFLRKTHIKESQLLEIKKILILYRNRFSWDKAKMPYVSDLMT